MPWFSLASTSVLYMACLHAGIGFKALFKPCSRVYIRSSGEDAGWELPRCQPRGVKFMRYVFVLNAHIACVWCDRRVAHCQYSMVLQS